MSSLHSVDSERGVVADAQAQAPVITEGDGDDSRSCLDTCCCAGCPSRCTPRLFVDAFRYTYSIIFQIVFTVIIFTALVRKETSFWDSVHAAVQVLLFISTVAFLGVVEGLQIALVELKKIRPERYKKRYSRAFGVAEVAFDGNNCERFLIGRQILVILLVFVSARLTTITGMTEIFGIELPAWFIGGLLETGLLGVIVVVVNGQLSPQIFAAVNPEVFLNIPGMIGVLYLTLWLEATGIAHPCWLITKFFARRKADRGAGADLDFGADANAEADMALLEDEDGLSNVVRAMPLSVMSSADGDRKMIVVSPKASAALVNYFARNPDAFEKGEHVVGSTTYATPTEIANEMTAHGLTVPRFLKPPGDASHVPPHIVACLLAAENARLRGSILGGRRVGGSGGVGGGVGAASATNAQQAWEPAPATGSSTSAGDVVPIKAPI